MSFIEIIVEGSILFGVTSNHYLYPIIVSIFDIEFAKGRSRDMIRLKRQRGVLTNPVDHMYPQRGTLERPMGQSYNYSPSQHLMASRKSVLIRHSTCFSTLPMNLDVKSSGPYGKSAHQFPLPQLSQLLLHFSGEGRNMKNRNTKS